MDIGAPALRQFLEGAYIQIAVVEKCLQLGHVFDEESAVLPNGIPAKWGFSFFAVLGKECQHGLFRFAAIHG